MVEVVAVAVKKRAQGWLRRVEEGETAILAQDGVWTVGEWRNSVGISDEKIQETRELITFLNGEWETDRPTRERYKSVEEVHRQQVELVGGEEILERLNRKISVREEDPIFLKEQLVLYRYRLNFFRSFFPYRAERFQTVVQCKGFPYRVEFVMDGRFGWWHLKGAGTHFLPSFAIIALDFERVVCAAFHMTGSEIYLDSHFTNTFEEDICVRDGFKYELRFHLVFVKDDVEDEIHNLCKTGVSVYEQEVIAEVSNSFSYVKRVVLALHKAGGPRSLKELAARKVHLLMEDSDMAALPLPKSLVEFLEVGLSSDPADLSPRGDVVWEAVLREEEQELRERWEEMERERLEEIENEREEESSVESETEG